MATVEFRYDPKNTAWFTANAAMVLKAGEPAYHDTTGLFKLGDGVTALSALSFLPTVSASTPTIQQVLTAGQVATTTIETTGFIKTGGLSTQFLKADGTVDSNVYGVGNALTSNPLSQFAATTSSQLAGVISDETGSGALVFGTSPTFTTDITTPQITGVSGVNGLRIITNNTASGAIARGLYHTPTLVASANGDELYGETINPTFTNGAFTTVKNFGLGIFCGTGSIKMGNSVGSTSVSAIYINKATPSNSNFAIQSAGTTLNINGGPAVDIMSDTQSMLTFNPNGGTTIPFLFKGVSLNSGTFTAANEVPIVKFNGNTYNWGTGTLATQRFHYLPANTVTFTAASTATNVYGLYVEAATAGTNATITNNYAAGFSGNVNVIGSLYSTGFILVDGTQGLNKVLVSDANGNASWATSSAGYARSFNNIAINTTGAAAANTDYYYFCTATLTFTLPTAVGNTNTYYIKVTSGTLTINTTSSQTIDGSLTIVTSVANTAFTLISDGTNWQII